MKETNQVPLPPVNPRKRSNVRAILITLACGVVLAIGSCFGAVYSLSMNRQTLINKLFMFGLIAGVALFAFGIVWGIMALIISVFYRMRGNKEQP